MNILLAERADIRVAMVDTNLDRRRTYWISPVFLGTLKTNSGQPHMQFIAAPPPLPRLLLPPPLQPLLSDKD
jgi:hypothetical protein